MFCHYAVEQRTKLLKIVASVSRRNQLEWSSVGANVRWWQQFNGGVYCRQFAVSVNELSEKERSADMPCHRSRVMNR